MTKQTDASPLGLAPEEERLLNEARDAFKNAKPEMTSRGGPKDELAGCGGDWNNRRSAACSRHAHMGVSRCQKPDVVGNTRRLYETLPQPYRLRNDVYGAASARSRLDPFLS